MLFIGHNLFNIGHCTFFTPLCKHIEKKNHHHTSHVAVMLSTSGWTPHNQLSSNPDSHWLQLLTMYDADPVLNVPEVWNSCWSICYGDSYRFVLLIVVWFEFSHWVQSHILPITFEMFQTLHLLVVTCSDVFWSLLLPLWSEELSCVLTCFPKLLICLDIPYLSFMSRICWAHLTKQPQCFPVRSSRATES